MTQEFIPKPRRAPAIQFEGGYKGGKKAAMEGAMREYVARYPNATVAVVSSNPMECRIEKPIGSGKA